MKLDAEGLKNTAAWKEKGYALPEYDREAMITKTRNNPVWLHFGAGNIFRAFQANAAQKMLNEGKSKTGIIVADGFDFEIVQKMYRPHDNYSILVTLKANGSIEKTVIGSIAESCMMDSGNEKEFGRMKEIFRAPSLQLVTFTITEKGYSLVDGKGAHCCQPLPKISSEGLKEPASYIGRLTALLYERYLAGQYPLALVSTDNCSHNGEKLHACSQSLCGCMDRKGLC
jgi:fructuronate reductase